MTKEANASSTTTQTTATSPSNENFLTPQQQSIRELEHPFLKVPFECLTKEFRSAQKSVEKDLTVLEKAVKEMNKKAQKSKVSQEDACKYIDKVVTKLVGVKRKLEETDVEQDRQLHICKARMEHLEPSSNVRTTNSDTEWNKIRLNRILVDYFLRSGYYDSAVKLANQTNLNDFVDMDVFVQSRKVVDGLKQRKCTEALAWCIEHKSKLKKLKNNFEFELRIQEFIELVRCNQRHEAITYARKYFKREDADVNSDKKQTEENEEDSWKKRTKQIQQAMALLAFGKETNLSPYKELFSDTRWSHLIELFQRSYFQLFSLTNQPLLHLNLQAGLSALKNPLAYQPQHYNVNNPMCNEKFQKLAEDLPFSFHIHSKLVCRITGQLMDDRNPPMVLPNGNVYSYDAMIQMAQRNNGMVEDPRTHEKFPFSYLKKSYIV